MNRIILPLLILFYLPFLGLSNSEEDSNPAGIIIKELVINDGDGEEVISAIELKGTEFNSFDVLLYTLAGSADANPGQLLSVKTISGTFGENDLFVADIGRLPEAPATYIISTFMETIPTPDFDGNNDGVIDNPSLFGNVYDAIGHGTSSDILYANQLGGDDFARPELPGFGFFFKDGLTADLYYVTPPSETEEGTVEDIDLNELDPDNFSADPFQTTFGEENPFFCDVQTGVFTFGNGNTELTACEGDDSLIFDIEVIDLGTSLFGFILIDSQTGIIQGVFGTFSLDLTILISGQYELVPIHGSPQGGLVGNTIDGLDSCFALAEALSITIIDPDSPDCIGEPQCPSEDVVLRSQADIEAFATQYPNCPDIPVSIFITEEGATFGDITDLSPLSFIETVDGDFTFAKITRLTNLTGLENLQSVSGFFGFTRMVRLADLSALSNLSTVGSLQFSSIRSLTDLSGLESLSSVEDQVRILYNRNLTSLNGLTLNNGIGGRLQILSNPNLSFCSNSAVCNHLNANKPAQIRNNAEGCNSIDEVFDLCFPPCARGSDHNIFLEVSPNPAIDQITLSDVPVLDQPIELTVLDSYGQVVKTLTLPAKGNQINITVADLPKGIYYLQFVDGETSYQSSFMKM